MGSRVGKEEVKVPHFFFQKFNRELIVAYQPMLRKDQFNEWQRKYRVVNQMNKQSLLLPQSYEVLKIDKAFACCECPADYQMNITFQRFDLLYKAQINKRIQQKKYYSQNELFYIFYNFVEAAKQFQIKGEVVGDIRSSNIVIIKSHKLKLITLASFPWQITALDKILDKFNNTTKFYLAPEQIQFIKQKRKVNLNNSKCEAFSIAVTLLEAAILEDSQQLYELKPRTINLPLLAERQSKCKDRYPLFESYLSKILSVKPEERYSSGEIWSVLKIYSQKISEVKEFKINKTRENDSLNAFRKSNR